MDIEKLARDAEGWFSTRQLHRQLFGEAALVFAVGESLGEAVDSLDVEKDFRHVTAQENVPAGYFNYDLIGYRGKKIRYLFEMKYLKGRSDRAEVSYERIVDDVIKLAAPSNDDLKRYIVLGRDRNLTIPDRVQKLLNAESVVICADRQDPGTAGDEALVIAPSARLTNSVCKLRLFAVFPQSCGVRCVSGADRSSSIAVSIYEVARLDSGNMKANSA